MSSYRFQSGVRGRGLSPLKRTLFLTRALVEAPILILEIPAILGNSRTKKQLTIQFMNDLCNGTLGKGLDFGDRLIRFARRSQTKEFDRKVAPQLRSQSNLSIEEIQKIVRELKDIGFARVPGFVSKESAARIRAEIHSELGRDSLGNKYRDIQDWINNGESGRIDTDDQAAQSAVSAENINFATLTLIAREYLGTSPILLGPHSWTTRQIDSKSDLQIEEEAMAYHCDSDFFGFLKVFLLLTDVSMNNGPFTFIRGSHRGKRHVQGRIADETLEVQPHEELFGTGEPGDVVLAATKGWHKATPPKEGVRTMVQWLYSNGLLGSTTQ